MSPPGSNGWIRDISKICPGSVFQQVELSKLSRWRIGGIADVVIHPRTREEVQALRQYFYQNGIHHITIGMTSNLLFADEGLRVPCIQIGNEMGEAYINGNVVTVQAGAWVPGLSRRIQRAGLTGAEHICGIPATIGGLICMNGGSQRKGIGSSILDVTSIDSSGEKHLRRADECLFSYRGSIFQTNNEVIVESRLRFDFAENSVAVRRTMLEILADRRRKFPREPNCGSVFKSNPDMYAKIGPPGAAIERLGLKGLQCGGAKVSLHHANFIVNAGGATASDVLALVYKISDAVKTATGYSIEAEVRYVDQYGRGFPVDDARVVAQHVGGGDC